MKAMRHHEIPIFLKVHGACWRQSSVSLALCQLRTRTVMPDTGPRLY